MNDQEIEQEIQAKGKTAPRITPADIEANIRDEHYFTAQEGVWGAEPGIEPIALEHEPLGLLTFCVLVLRNGFTVTGESACASSENFDAEIGRKIARQNAVQKIWPLMGYELKRSLHGVDAPTDAHIAETFQYQLSIDGGSVERAAINTVRVLRGEPAQIRGIA